MLTGPERPACNDHSNEYAGACCIIDTSGSVQRGSARGTEVPYSLHVTCRASAETWPNVSWSVVAAGVSLLAKRGTRGVSLSTVRSGGGGGGGVV